MTDIEKSKTITVNTYVEGEQIKIDRGPVQDGVLLPDQWLHRERVLYKFHKRGEIWYQARLPNGLGIRTHYSQKGNVFFPERETMKDNIRGEYHFSDFETGTLEHMACTALEIFGM